MMTIDGAIDYASDNADYFQNEYDSNWCNLKVSEDYVERCGESAENYRQFVSWLTALKGVISELDQNRPDDIKIHNIRRMLEDANLK